MTLEASFHSSQREINFHCYSADKFEVESEG